MGSSPRWALVAAFLVASPIAWADETVVPVQARLLEAQVRLGNALLTQLQETSASDSVAVSPAGAAGLLATVFLGADDGPRALAAKALQLEPGTTTSADLDALHAALADRGGASEMTSATRIVFAPSALPTEAASARLAAAGVDVAVADLSKQATVDEINAWVAKATHGKVNQIFDRPSTELGIVGLNALYFAGHWKLAFSESETEPADFATAAGGRIRAPFMHTPPGDFARREDASYIAVDLPFENDRFSMVVLTTKGTSVGLAGFNAHLGWLTGRDFERLQIRTVVDLPRFHVAADADLIPALAGLGLRLKGPFPNLTTADVHLSAVRQKVDVTLNENGAEVAAVTAAGFRVQAGTELDTEKLSEIAVDRPFVFALREGRTGLIIVEGFVGAVEGTIVAEGQSVRSARSRSVLSEAQVAKNQAAKAAAQRSQIPFADPGANASPSDSPSSARLTMRHDF